MDIDQLINSRAKARLISRSGEDGIHILLERWNKLSSRLQLKIISRSELGVYSALLTVLYKNKEVILKICTVPDIFSGQNEALRLAPPKTVPQVIASFPEEEAWLLEKLPGTSGQSGQFVYQEGAALLDGFHKGETNDKLFDLVAHHMNIAKRVNSSCVLQQEKRYMQLNQVADEGLVHGDALPENILVGKEKMWLIDPTGYKGDVAFDFATLALYSRDPLSSLHKASLSFGKERIFAWAWLRAQLSYQQSVLAKDNQGVKPLIEVIPHLQQEVAWLPH